jgi:hypothetical protein
LLAGVWSMERALPHYELRRALPSCLVSRQLLIELERYLLDQSGELPDVCKCRKFDLLLEDRFGTETFDSARFLPQQPFPDDTKGVQMELDAHTHETKSDWARLSIRLSFGKTRLDSMASISFTGLKAREYVEGLWAAIERRTDPHRTMTGWFHYPRAFLPTLVVLVLGVLLGTAFGERYGFWPVIVALNALVYASMGAMPYSAFDTKSHETWQTVLKWVFFGLAPSLIAGYYFLLKPK